MRTLSRLAGTTVAASTLLTAAHAADMPAPMPAPEPASPAPVVHDWTGIYAGIHGGHGWGDFRARVPGAELDTVEDLGPLEVDEEITRDPFSHNFDTNGWHGGLQAGANWQVNQWVFGLEGDWSWSGADGSRSLVYELDVDGADGPIGFSGTADVPTTFSHDLKWFATLRGRVGFAMDQFLLYGTGGLAHARSELSVAGDVPDLPEADLGALAGPFSSNDTQSHTGWTIGGGIEAAITPELSIKAEYLYMDLGSETYDLQFPAGPAAVDGKLEQHVVRAGLNYRFTW